MHVKWNISCHVGGEEMLQLSESPCPLPPKNVNFWATPAYSNHKFLSHVDKRHHSLHEKLKDVTVISDYSPLMWPKGFQTEKNTAVKMLDAGPR